MPFSILPILFKAYFTGMGLDSTNISLCSGSIVACTLVAVSKSPFKAAVNTSLIALGTILAVTEMLPLAPCFISSKAVPSSPDRTTIRSPNASISSLPRSTDPVASLIATIFSMSAKRSTVSCAISTTVRPGTL